MRNQLEWTANRGYIQHIEALKKISSRKMLINQKQNSIKQRNSEPFNDVSQNKGNDSKLMRYDDNATLRQRQILWENYFLGKRIIQTNPVICKKKLDEEFRQHKRILGCLTSSGSRKSKCNQFRIKKLQEYKQQLEHNEGITNRSIIKVTINSIAFYRQKPTLDNVELLFSYLNKNNKTHIQNSERYAAEEILERPFDFIISKRLVNDKGALTIQIRNIKGLNQFSIGYFSFPSCEVLDKFECQLFHCGKPIGEIEVSTAYNKKSHVLKTTE